MLCSVSNYPYSFLPSVYLSKDTYILRHPVTVSYSLMPFPLAAILSSSWVPVFAVYCFTMPVIRPGWAHFLQPLFTSIYWFLLFRFAALHKCDVFCWCFWLVMRVRRPFSLRGVMGRHIFMELPETMSCQVCC